MGKLNKIRRALRRLPPKEWNEARYAHVYKVRGRGTEVSFSWWSRWEGKSYGAFIKKAKADEMKARLDETR